MFLELDIFKNEIRKLKNFFQLVQLLLPWCHSVWMKMRISLFEASLRNCWVSMIGTRHWGYFENFQAYYLISTQLLPDISIITWWEFLSYSLHFTFFLKDEYEVNTRQFLTQVLYARAKSVYTAEGIELSSLSVWVRHLTYFNEINVKMVSKAKLE